MEDNVLPFLKLKADGAPLAEVKLSLVLYLETPMSPDLARQVYDLYMKRFGETITIYQSTDWVGPPSEWDFSARVLFETKQLPKLMRRSDWGYAFSDERQSSGYLFMFHGYKPASGARRASFVRFEWPWDYDSSEIVTFATELIDTVPFLSGTGGYIVSARPLNSDAFDYSYALCQRYWGLEAWELDLTVKYVLSGYKCPSWLTLIGNQLMSKFPGFVLDAAVEAIEVRGRHGVAFKSRAEPQLIDRNRHEPCDAERSVARALLPLQITDHADFSGRKWTGRTIIWLKRFTED